MVGQKTGLSTAYVSRPEKKCISSRGSILKNNACGKTVPVGILRWMYVPAKHGAPVGSSPISHAPV